jgi:hypothetical protein
MNVHFWLKPELEAIIKRGRALLMVNEYKPELFLQSSQQIHMLIAISLNISKKKLLMKHSLSLSAIHNQLN